MMHHPNMHHQAMSGHPPQHLPGHRAISAHHTLPPPLHGENRHVTLTRVPLGPGAGGHTLGALGGMVPAHAPHAPHAPRPPHAIRAMHHPPQQHHVPPQQMKQMRRGYIGGGYGAGGAVLHTYAPSPQHTHTQHTGLPGRTLMSSSATKKLISDLRQLVSDRNLQVVMNPVVSPPTACLEPAAMAEAAAEAAACAGADRDLVGDEAAPGDDEAARPASATPANSKEKTPMCLVNELARYNKIKHQYRLTSETGPAHKKVFTVTLRLGDTEEYTAEGSSIKRAQHAAASAALSATSFPAPPPRAASAHSPPHAHHRHSVMPTVELNALAMKLCQPAVYTSVPPVPLGARSVRARWPPFPRVGGPALVYRVRVAVGGRAWLGEGGSPQAARHDAAARALQDLRLACHDHADPPPLADAEENGDPLTMDVKSPVSLVHELALKRNLTVLFTVKSERGPPHMRVFVTICTVGDMETEGEGNGKKVSKRRAAEKMLEEMRRRWPPALLRPRVHQDKRRHQPAKKKPRNLIKESAESPGAGAGAGAGGGGGGGAGGDNPISVLAVARHAERARSPQYLVLEERGAARRREFLVQCVAPPHAATGLGPNKKTAKRRAAHNVLLAMELTANGTEPTITSADASPASSADSNTTANETKRKDSDGVGAGGANSEVRQPVPGVLMMDYHQRSGQPHQPNGDAYSSAGSGASEGSATGGAGGTTPGAKDQLMYLSQLLGFTVQFSDFPKRNHGEYLSLVSLSTEPPVMCHGGGPSTAHSHEQCSRAALRQLALMGLDTMQGAGVKPNAISNGIAE